YALDRQVGTNDAKTSDITSIASQAESREGGANAVDVFEAPYRVSFCKTPTPARVRRRAARLILRVARRGRSVDRLSDRERAPQARRLGRHARADAADARRQAGPLRHLDLGPHARGRGDAERRLQPALLAPDGEHRDRLAGRRAAVSPTARAARRRAD